MSLSWSEVSVLFSHLAKDASNDIPKAVAIVEEVVPIVEAAASVVGGPTAASVISVLQTLSGIIKVVSTAESATASTGSVTASQAATAAVAIINALKTA